MGSGGRRSPKGGLSNTGGAQKLKFKTMDPAAQNSMLAVQRQKQTGAALKAIHNYIDPTCYASNGFNHAQNLNQALNTGRPLTAKQKATESGLKSIMTPMQDNYILYRGDHDDMLRRIGINMQQFNSTRSTAGDTQLQQALVGQSWVNKGFTSTSHTKGMSPFLPGGPASGGREVILNIQAKKGTKAALIQRSQAEVLLDTGTRFTITGAHYTGATAYPKQGGAKRQIIIDVTAE